MTTVLELLPEHSPFWQQFALHYARGRMPHAYLLTAAPHRQLGQLASRMLAGILCPEDIADPCGQCQSCRLMSKKEHPDVFFVHSEKPRGMLKIEQIRFLQQKIYTTPFLSSNRGIVINPADRMNRAAANALLKILEEPPKNTYFFLIAEHISTLTATIISRCQRWNIPTAIADEKDDYAGMDPLGADNGRANIIGQQPTIIQDLIDITSMDASFNAVALKWSIYDFTDLVWLLYRIHAQMIADALSQQTPKILKTDQLISQVSPVRLFMLLEKLQEITKLLAKNITISPMLWIESFLLGYVHAALD